MRKITLLLLIITVFAVACKTSTEDKLKTAIKEYETSQLKNDEKLESFRIDSIQYYLGSMKSIYVDTQLKYFDLYKNEDEDYLDYAMSHIDKFQPSIDSIKVADNLDQSDATYKFAKTTNNNVFVDHWKIEDLKKTLQKKAETADTLDKFYIVKYQYTMKSNKDSQNGHNTLYINASDFKIKPSPVDWVNHILIE